MNNLKRIITLKQNEDKKFLLNEGTFEISREKESLTWLTTKDKKTLDNITDTYILLNKRLKKIDVHK